MAFDVPEGEPTRLAAGDRWRWTRQDLNDYPASTWTLKYHLRRKGEPLITITASADGDDFEVDEAAADTANWSAGDYFWQAEVDDGTSRHIVDEGWLTIDHDPETAVNEDPRSVARQMVDLYESFFTGTISVTGLDKASSSIAGRSFARRSLEELRRDYQFWRGELKKERRREAARKGKPHDGIVRFRLP